MSKITDRIRDGFNKQVEKYGISPSGAFWHSAEARDQRWDQLLKVIDTSNAFSLSDLGCGVGTLYSYIANRFPIQYYIGYEISDKAIEEARKLYKDELKTEFIISPSIVKKTDYCVCNGAFNMKFEFDEVDWMKYIKQALINMDDMSTKGFAFNMLTWYSERSKMKKELFYADPCYYFDLCKNMFSKNIALLHDYNMYDFTIIVRK